jgi:hypothetical protein
MTDTNIDTTNLALAVTPPPLEMAVILGVDDLDDSASAAEAEVEAEAPPEAAEPLNPAAEAASRGFALFAAGTPGEPRRVLSQSGDFNRKGHGTGVYLRAVLPGTTTSGWATDLGETEGDYNAREKSGTNYSCLPEGTIVLRYTTETNRFGKGPATLEPGVVVRWKDADGKTRNVVWGDDAGLVARRKAGVPIVTLPNAGVPIVTLPNGTKLSF